MPSISSAQVKVLDGILSAAVESKRIPPPPALFTVSTSEGTIYTKAAGNIGLDDQTSAPLDENTIFMLCSQTKLITSIAALQLIEQGKLSFSTHAADFFPELANVVIPTGKTSTDGKPATRPAKTPITIQHLFNHSSGLNYDLVSKPGLGDAYTYNYTKGDNPSTVFKILQHDYPGVPINFEPGSAFAYGMSTDVLGFVVEKISGLSLEDYFQKYIFNPLGVKASFHGDTLGNRARVSFRNPDGKLTPLNGELCYHPQENVNLFLGGVGLYSSQASYLAVLRHILQVLDGTATQPILKLQSAQSLFAETLPESALPSLNTMLQSRNNQWGNGLCIHTKDIPGQRKAGSGAWGGWAGTFYWIDPTSGIAAIFGSQLGQGAMDPGLNKVFVELEKALYAGLNFEMSKL